MRSTSSCISSCSLVTSHMTLPWESIFSTLNSSPHEHSCHPCFKGIPHTGHKHCCKSSANQACNSSFHSIVWLYHIWMTKSYCAAKCHDPILWLYHTFLYSYNPERIFFWRYESQLKKKRYESQLKLRRQFSNWQSKTSLVSDAQTVYATNRNRSQNARLSL